ncbi:MAG: Rid family hydrolase [Burkholderiaceae bacterium]
MNGGGQPSSSERPRSGERSNVGERPAGWALPQVRRRGERLYIGNVLPVSETGAFAADADIGAQTHLAFQRLRDALASAGAELADLVRINTYYVYQGPEDGATRYWERMTAVRLQYFADPGPVGTAVRVAGTARDGALIQLEAEALLPSERAARQRIMPADSWDWSVPVPLSQGWRHGDYVWVGGQVCADRQGRAVSLGQLEAQTDTVLRYISNVLRDGGMAAEQLLHLKICYLHDGDAAAAERRLAAIKARIDAVYGDAVPAITAFGVNLLYEGLLLEIDASAASGARVDRRDESISSSSSISSVASVAPTASIRGRYLQTGGHSMAPAAGAAAPLADCLLASAGACLRTIAEAGGSAGDVCRLTAFVARPAWREAALPDAGPADAEALQRSLRALWPAAAAPSITVSVVEGLPGNAPVQVDALAWIGN